MTGETQKGNEGDVTAQLPLADNTNETPAFKGPPYDLLLTIVGASHLAVGDLHGKSDPYIIGKLKNPKGLVSSQPNASRVHFRTSTQRSTREPEWNERWKFGGVREGTYLKLKLFDEDPKKRWDDKLGSSKLVLTDLEKDLKDGEEHTRQVPIRAYKGKKHIQLFTAFYDLCNPEAHAKSPEAHITVKLQLLPSDNASILNVYLQTPTCYSVHSPPLASLVATTPSRKNATDVNSKTVPGQDATSASSKPSTPKDQGTSFKAYKIALIHPPPYSSLQFEADISHAKSFDPSKVRYRMSRRFIRKQYQNMYGHDRNTVYGSWWDADEVGPGLVQLLQPVENKLFTFVITLDGEWRFCETGDEYKINHLSKHGMHADGNEVVVWAGEFMIRRDESTSVDGSVDEIEGLGKYTIYLDNDSGTYSPDKEKLGDFRSFMANNLRGISVVTKNFKDEWLKEAKKDQKGETEEKEDGSKEKEPRKLADVLDEEDKRRRGEIKGEPLKKAPEGNGTEPSQIDDNVNLF